MGKEQELWGTDRDVDLMGTKFVDFCLLEPEIQLSKERAIVSHSRGFPREGNAKQSCHF